MSRNPIAFWDLPSLWSAASIAKRAQAFLPPLLVPLALFAEHPFIPMLFSTGVLVVCLFVGLVRLCLLPFRWGDGSRLLAWRLPLATVLAVGVFVFIQYGTGRATADLRDTMVGLQDERSATGARWLCAPESQCRIKIGRSPVVYTAFLSRDVKVDGSVSYEGRFMPFQDSWIVFEIDESGSIEAWSRTDIDTKALDIETLMPMASAEPPH